MQKFKIYIISKINEHYNGRDNDEKMIAQIVQLFITT